MTDDAEQSKPATRAEVEQIRADIKHLLNHMSWMLLIIAGATVIMFLIVFLPVFFHSVGLLHST